MLSIGGKHSETKETTMKLATLADVMGEAFAKNTFAVKGQYDLTDLKLTKIHVKLNFLEEQHGQLAEWVDEKITIRPHVDFKRKQGVRYVDLGKQVMTTNWGRLNLLRIGLTNNDWRLTALYKYQSRVPDQKDRRKILLRTTVVQEWTRRSEVDDGARPTLPSALENPAVVEKIAALDALPKIRALDGEELEVVRELCSRRQWKNIFVWMNPPGMYPDQTGELTHQEDGILTINARGPGWDNNPDDAAASLVVRGHKLIDVSNLPAVEGEQ